MKTMIIDIFVMHFIFADQYVSAIVMAMSSNRTMVQIKNKAAIDLQYKSNVKLMAALLFIPYYRVV